MKNLMRTLMLATIALAVSVTLHAAPANDDWSNAILLQGSGGNVDGTVAGATLQQCEPTVHTFPDEGQVSAAKTVWYKFRAPYAASYTFSFYATETPINAVVSAYRMQLVLCNGNLMQVPYRIDESHRYNSAFMQPVQKGRISFRAVANEEIYISVDSYTFTDGPFQLTWSKTRFRYDAQLDHANGGADLVVNRFSIFGPTQWWMARYKETQSFTSFATQPFGLINDKTFMADFDGDGISDMAAVRQTGAKSVWWIANRDGQVIKVVEFGLDTDKPIVGDYDGDGIADIAVTRNDPTTHAKIWHILRSSDGQYTGMQFGLASDQEMLGDYDGDGTTDIVVLRPENGTFTWFIRYSGNETVGVRVFGNTHSDIPQTANFDGDGKTDIAVFRRNDPNAPEYNGYWFSVDTVSQLPLDQRSTRYQKFGQTDDIPQAADFDGDMRTDLGVYRNGEWWVRKTRDGQVARHMFGSTFDVPMADGGRTWAQRTYYSFAE